MYNKLFQPAGISFYRYLSTRTSFNSNRDVWPAVSAGMSAPEPAPARACACREGRKENATWPHKQRAGGSSLLCGSHRRAPATPPCTPSSSPHSFTPVPYSYCFAALLFTKLFFSPRVEALRPVSAPKASPRMVTTWPRSVPRIRKT